MAICKHCGEEIEFRFVNGNCVPIHPGGGWHCGWHSGSESHTSHSPSKPPPIRTGEWRERDFTRPTRCPKCDAAVFFIRHNDGCVWVDDLGWPWPKHGCFDLSGEPTRKFSLWAAKYSGLTNPKLGIITRAKSGLRITETVLEIRFTDESLMSLTLLGTPFDSSLLGALVIVSQEDGRLSYHEHAWIPFHRHAEIPQAAPRTPLARTADDLINIAIEAVAKRAWEAVGDIDGSDEQFKRAKHEALRLIAMLSPSIKRQVGNSFTSEKWKPLLELRPNK